MRLCCLVRAGAVAAALVVQLAQVGPLAQAAAAEPVTSVRTGPPTLPQQKRLLLALEGR